jgi:hypothetical protein
MALDLVTLNHKEEKLGLVQVDAAPHTPESSEALHRKLAKFGQSPALNDATADFVITCDGKRFNAHKSVLAAACPYFERMFRFEGKVFHRAAIVSPELTLV